MKPLFTQGPHISLQLLACIILSFVFMVMDHRLNYLAGVRSALAIVLYPIQTVVDMPSNVSTWASESLSSNRSQKEQIQSLEAQNLLLKAQLQKLAALETENIRLRKLQVSSFDIGERLLIAEIMSVDLEPFSRKIRLNKGSHDGVFVGQALIEANGVMGSVIQVTPLYSDAMLLTDPGHAIPLLVNRNGLRAIGMGMGTSDKIEVPNIPNNADIQVGDLLVTSGLGGHFPHGYPVATVTTVTKNPNQPFLTIYAQTSAKLEQSREALLVQLATTDPLTVDETAAQHIAPQESETETP